MTWRHGICMKGLQRIAAPDFFYTSLAVYFAISKINPRPQIP